MVTYKYGNHEIIVKKPLNYSVYNSHVRIQVITGRDKQAVW